MPRGGVAGWYGCWWFIQFPVPFPGGHEWALWGWGCGTESSDTVLLVGSPGNQPPSLGFLEVFQKSSYKLWCGWKELAINNKRHLYLVIWEIPIFFQLYFNWRLITLQYCSGFCHTLTQISHGCTCVPHPEPPSLTHPSESSQCTSSEHPVSCIESGLTICFTSDKVHISVLFSQIIPPLPSPTESKRLLYICVLLLSCI